MAPQLTARISPEFEDEAISEIEDQLQYIGDLSKGRYGENAVLYKLKWWRLIRKGELFPPLKAYGQEKSEEAKGGAE